MDLDKLRTVLSSTTEPEVKHEASLTVFSCAILILFRDAPDTVFAGYPAGRISG
jgi:hypothetical protein